MIKTVSGVFYAPEEANRAMANLAAAGFNEDDISLLVTDVTRKTMFSADASVDANDAIENSGEKIVKGSLTGATFGGALGALIAGLTAIGGLAIPGANILVAGSLIAAFTGAGAGALTGGLTGALVGAGFDSGEAAKYEEELSAGRAVVIVHSDDESRLSKARAALRDAGASSTNKAA